MVYLTNFLSFKVASMVANPLIGNIHLISQPKKFPPVFYPNMRQLTQRARNPGLNPRKNVSSVGYYMASLAVAMFGVTFAAVPLYRIYCRVTGKGGQAFKDEDNKIVNMKKDLSRPITVNFTANAHSSLAWNFVPLQSEVKVYPGETALAFYRATNPLDELVVGIATYTILPYEAGIYFNKIQCFCFEEQMLRPKEDVFMPVLFYIDPEFSRDPKLSLVDQVTLSYTFFRSKDGEFPDDIDDSIELKKHD